MRLKNMKIVYLVGPEFEDLEFWVPLMRLQEEGALVTVAGPKAGKYPGKNGLEAEAGLSFDQLHPLDYDAVVVPGGWAPDKIRRYEGAKKVVHEIYQAGKVVGMICHAGLVGISAGIVAGHSATGSEGIKDDLVNAGATWRDEPAFCSRNIVWGRVVADIPFFCRELVNALEKQQQPG